MKIQSYRVIMQGVIIITARECAVSGSDFGLDRHGYTMQCVGC
jgi:hypothetical protein